MSDGRSGWGFLAVSVNIIIQNTLKIHLQRFIMVIASSPFSLGRKTASYILLYCGCYTAEYSKLGRSGSISGICQGGNAHFKN